MILLLRRILKKSIRFLRNNLSLIQVSFVYGCYGYFKAFGSSFEFMFSPVSHCIFPTDKYFEKIIELNDVAALKLNDGQ